MDKLDVCLITGTITAAFLTLLVWAILAQCTLDDTREEAVLRGHAEWHIDADGRGEARFRWKDRAP